MGLSSGISKPLSLDPGIGSIDAAVIRGLEKEEREEIEAEAKAEFEALNGETLAYLMSDWFSDTDWTLLAGFLKKSDEDAAGRWLSLSVRAALTLKAERARQ